MQISRVPRGFSSLASNKWYGRVSLVVIALHAASAVAADVALPSLNRPYDQCAFLATHNSYANPDEYYFTAQSNQPDSITAQLNYGVRVINLDIWLVRQKPSTLGCWIWEAYTTTNTDVLDADRFAPSDPIEVVVGHSLDIGVADVFHDPCLPWKPLRQVLNNIAAWLDNNPNNVVTLQFENKIRYSYEIDTDHIIPAIYQSALAGRFFHPNGNNPSIPAPGGRPDGWTVDKYGYPTLRQLIDAGKTVVLYPHYLPRAAPGNPNVPGSLDSWKLEVMTVYGNACLNSNAQAWVEARGESSLIDDFTRPLFSVIHVPDIPTAQNFGAIGGINDIRTLRLKWDDIRNRYNRLPTAVWFDYYERGYNGLFNPGDPPGPAMFVNELNDLWNGLSNIGASSQTFPAPSIHGWHNTNVLVALNGTGSGQAIISRVFGETNTAAAALASYLLRSEGTNTVRFHAVGPLGKRSAIRLTDIRIDKTNPTITGAVDRAPDRGRWYRAPVTVSFGCSDQLSGIASCPSNVVLATSGAGLSATGLTTDRADNTAGATITNINIDLDGPAIRAAADRPVLRHVGAKVSFGSERERYNVNRLVRVIISGAITDPLSGVNTGSASYSVDDEYDRVEPAGHIQLDSRGRFSFTLRLEPLCARGDEDGRQYRIRLRSSDRAGHTTDKFVRVSVRP